MSPPGATIGLFALLVLLIFLVWVLARLVGNEKEAEAARHMSQNTFRGAHEVATLAFGSAGGQGTPDFGQPPVAGELEPGGDHVVQVQPDSGGLPPRPLAIPSPKAIP